MLQYNLPWFWWSNSGISEKRLKWHGIESLEKSKSKILDVIYAKDCDCEFDLDDDFKCSCRWHRKITLGEHKSFHDLRILLKARIHSLSEYDFIFITLRFQTSNLYSFFVNPYRSMIGVIIVKHRTNKKKNLSRTESLNKITHWNQLHVLHFIGITSETYKVNAISISTRIW